MTISSDYFIAEFVDSKRAKFLDEKLTKAYHDLSYALIEQDRNTIIEISKHLLNAQVALINKESKI